MKVKPENGDTSDLLAGVFGAWAVMFMLHQFNGLQESGCCISPDRWGILSQLASVA